MYHGLTPPTFSIPDAVRCVTMAFLQIAIVFNAMIIALSMLMQKFYGSDVGGARERKVNPIDSFSWIED
jgi:hypothetical protein